MSAPPARPIVFAITGASGAPYAIRLLEQLIAAQRRVQLIISSHGLRLLQTESGVRSAAELRERVGGDGWDRFVKVFDDADRGAAPASGSSRNGGMVICPCSMGTLSAIAVGASLAPLLELLQLAASATAQLTNRMLRMVSPLNR